jgi:arabinose-5-phosphate isomerase
MERQSRILERARNIIDVEARAVLRAAARLDETFVALVDRLLALEGHLAVTGVGKSGIIGEKISATLSSTGQPSFFLKPVEALHGDLGMLRSGDCLLAISNSGETSEVLAVVGAARELGVEIFAFTGVADSSLARSAFLSVITHVEHEACPLDLAPTASTTVTLAIGDALAMVLLEERKFTKENYRRFHPGGSLGQRLEYRVRDIMRENELLPLVRPDATLRAALEEMTRKDNLGVTLVANEDGVLVGILTDGDLRRLLLGGSRQVSSESDILSQSVSLHMGRQPRTIDIGGSVADALQIMEARGITSLAVLGPQARVAGIIHLHDILGRGKVVL